jgi:hypothetical protein
MDDRGDNPAYLFPTSKNLILAYTGFEVQAGTT